MMANKLKALGKNFSGYIIQEEEDVNNFNQICDKIIFKIFKYFSPTNKDLIKAVLASTCTILPHDLEIRKPDGFEYSLTTQFTPIRKRKFILRFAD